MASRIRFNRANARIYRTLAACSHISSTRAVSLLLNSLKCRSARTSRSIWFMPCRAASSCLDSSARPKRAAGGRELTQQMERQAGGSRVGAPPAMDRKVACGIPLFCPEVPPVQLDQRLVDDHSEPDEIRMRSVPLKVSDSIDRLQPGILQHIVRIDPSLKLGVHPEVHHPPESRPVN